MTNCPYFNSSSDPKQCELTCPHYAENRACTDSCVMLFVGMDNKTCKNQCETQVIFFIESNQHYRCITDCLAPLVRLSTSIGSDPYYLCAVSCPEETPYNESGNCVEQCE